MRRRAARTLAATGLALAVAGCAASLVRNGALDAERYASVERGVEATRGLRFTAAVPARVLDDAAVARLLDEELARSLRPGDLERVQATFGRLGLLPTTPPLRPMLEELYRGQMAALYDPRTKTLALTQSGLRQGGFGMRLLGALTGRDFVGELLVAHELTHALQDQHFGLPTEASPIVAGASDRVIARRALAEGDATLASFAFLQGRPLDPDTTAAIVDELDRLPDELANEHPDAPELVRASLAFQYQAGTAFVASALSRGGWPAVDAAHRSPPTSTEQVLHPARYFDTRDAPTEIALGGTEDLERSGWSRIVEDTLGELDVRVLARQRLPRDEADGVAAGWDGDRLRALARDDDVAIVWMTVWDTAADAVEFAEAVPALVPAASVERRGERVLVLVGAEAMALGPPVWTRTRFEAHDGEASSQSPSGPATTRPSPTSFSR